MATRTAVDRARLYAATHRVFTTAELSADQGDDAGRAAATLVAQGDLVRHAQGVMSLPGIHFDDERVQDKIAEVGARALSEASLRSKRAVEDRVADKLAKRATRETAETMPERVRKHFADHPVALASDLRRVLGSGAGPGADALVKSGELRRVEDGLFVRAGIDPLGPEMQAYAERHSAELSEVKRQIDAAAALEANDETRTGEIQYGVWRVEGRSTQVYITVPGMPVIYAQTVGRGPSRRIGWYGKKGSGLGPLAAEHIARMVFNPLPDDIRTLVDMVEAEQAPRQARKRSGSYRGPAPATPVGSNEYSDRYVAGDGVRLDPSRLTDPLPESVTLEMDDREDDRLLSRLASVPNLHIIRQRLAVGDFRARHHGKTLLFERKTSADLAASIDDGRLTSQVREMSTLGHTCCFLIEGGVFAARQQPIARLAAIQSRLTFGMNMPLIETLDLEHTAYEIVVAIRDHFFGTGSKFDLAPRKLKAVGALEVARVMLETIPGVSTSRAAALLTRFGSIAGIAAAEVKEIATVEGIGKMTAQILRDTLHVSGLHPNG